MLEPIIYVRTQHVLEMFPPGDKCDPDVCWHIEIIAAKFSALIRTIERAICDECNKSGIRRPELKRSACAPVVSTEQSLSNILISQ